jgi:PAS domain S-box-containing protein
LTSLYVQKFRVTFIKSHLLSSVPLDLAIIKAQNHSLSNPFMSASTMSQTVTRPVFGSASAQPQTPADTGQSEWQMDSGGDPMDFDLLAEYLLDDNSTGNTNGLSFDFNADSANTSSVVSPDQSVGGANTGVAQAQQIISQHAAVHQQHQHVQHQNHMLHRAVQQAQVVMAAPAPLAPAPAHLAPAPAGVAAQPSMVASQGIHVPHAPVSYAHPATHIAPAPTIDAQGGVSTGIAHQTNNVVTKRRRMNAPMAALSGGTVSVLADPMAVAAALQGRGRKKTQAQIDRRRERNRILARRTRLRKKFFFESLQKEVVDLQRENCALRDIVRTELAADGEQLLDECDAAQKLPAAVLEACGEHGDIDQQDFNLVRSIQQSQHSFIITDPSLEDNPIVFASDDFLSLTGYSREDILGRNCRFLQGTETSQSKVEEIRKGLAVGDDVSVTLVNYTADGTPFWNKLFIAALRDAQSNIVNFIGVIAKVSGPEPSDPEHGKRLPGENSMDDDDMFDDDDDDDDKFDSNTAAMVADGNLKAIEGVVDAAVASAPSVVLG